MKTNRTNSAALATLLLTASAALTACGQARPSARFAASGAGAGCTECHGDALRGEPTALLAAAPPYDVAGHTGTASPGVGAHQAHLHAGPLGGPVACTECHRVPSTIDHAGLPLDLTFGPLATRGGAAPVFDPTLLTCATSYCHGATLAAGGTNHAPRWTGGSGEVACGTCHGAPPPSHAASSTSCNACHPGTVKPDGTIDAAGGLHVNGVVEAQGGGHPAGWAAKAQHGYSANALGLTSCKGCHGAALDGGTSGVSCATCHAAAGFASWSTSCTFCHGNRATGRQSPPVDTQGRSATSAVSVGVHDAHVGTTLSAPITCAQCHPARGDVITDAAHVDGNGQAEVLFGALATAGGAAPVYSRTGPTQATCASTYCHGGFPGGPRATMSWTSAAKVTCSSCHGAPPATGRHRNHAGRSCGDCHPGYTTTTVNAATHVNGSKQVGNRITSFNPATGACVGCHGADTW